MSHLTEPGIRAFAYETLRTCKFQKMKYYTKVLNLSLFAAFVFIGGCILLYKYKGKISPQEKNEKKEADRLYILNRVKQVQLDKQKQSNLLITDVPGPNNFLF